MNKYDFIKYFSIVCRALNATQNFSIRVQVLIHTYDVYDITSVEQ